jgi:ATP-binding cassette, subfamily B, bacterial HlyB/CyaB
MVSHPSVIERDDFVWALGAMCRVHRIPFDPARILQEYPPPYSLSLLLQAAHALGFRARALRTRARRLSKSSVPCIVTLKPSASSGSRAVANLGLLMRVGKTGVDMIEPHGAESGGVSLETFNARFSGEAIQFQPAPGALASPDIEARPRFGFGWFVPELLRHKSMWFNVAVASLVLQLVALATPLLTQVIIDKVVAHRTVNTLAAIAVALAIFALFTAVMSWARQHVLLYTGSRIDAVLGNRVFEHLLSLPARYFEARPTGTLVARLQGIETIREFLAGAAVTLVLDLPFVAVFMAVMFYYSVDLTLLALVLVAVMVALSIGVAPIIRRRIDRQFLVGARNQAFLTEYVAGMATVKSLQMEPQLRRRYGDYLSDYLSSAFRTRTVHNSYNVAMHALEQTLALGVLCLGAWEVMRNDGFTVGMLVAFQMFTARLAQPLLRLSGLWQEFQQAAIAVKRLGDLMDAPREPMSMQMARTAPPLARIEVEALYFRHGERSSELFAGLSFTVEPGSCMLVTGPSGTGKSTLVKLLQGLYTPERGRIRLNGHDLRALPVNELRCALGVVPQETVLFSGTVHENLLLANPQADFEQVVHACTLAGIHETIEALPDGYLSVIGEQGSGLSGGQRQRIAIARALLRRPRALLFDEATSQLDAASAATVVRTINQLKGRVTLIVVAHEVPAGLEADSHVALGDSGLEESRER